MSISTLYSWWVIVIGTSLEVTLKGHCQASVWLSGRASSYRAFGKTRLEGLVAFCLAGLCQGFKSCLPTNVFGGWAFFSFSKGL